jgi:hypothetical protein
MKHWIVSYGEHETTVAAKTRGKAKAKWLQDLDFDISYTDIRVRPAGVSELGDEPSAILYRCRVCSGRFLRNHSGEHPLLTAHKTNGDRCAGSGAIAYTPEEKVQQWNDSHDVGAPVVYWSWITDRARSEPRHSTTRSAAFVQGDHASIFIVGASGSWNLDFVQAREGDA